MRALHESDGCLVYNVQLKTNYGGFLSDPLYVAIERPKRLVKPFGTPDPFPSAQPGGGYISLINYSARGLCNGQGALRGYVLNENFTNINNGSTNWPLTEDGLFLGPTTSVWADQIGAQAGNWCGGICAPVPEIPIAPLSTIVRQTADQSWGIGSIVGGNGVVVQRNQLRRFIDHGDHTNIVSPSN